MSTIIKQLKSGMKNNEENDGMVCELKHPIPKEIIFECSPSSAIKTFSRTGQSFTAACVALDTTCIFKPKVKIEFSSIVTLNVANTDGIDVRLRFDLIKVCDNKEELSCGIWMYEKVLPGILSSAIELATDSFSFIFCDWGACPGCCQYYVKVTSESLPESFDELVTVNVSGSSIAAIAI